MVYASVQSRTCSEDELCRLVESSRRRNAQHGISAVLLRQEGTFLHGLEGETEQVRALFAKVSADPRHESVQPLVQIEVERRLFTGQPMTFHEVQEDELSFGRLEDVPFDVQGLPRDISWRGCIALQLLARYRS